MNIFYTLTACAAVSGYLLGGINSAIIFSTAIYHKDIRKHGSCNPGFTNFKRVFGNGILTWLVMIIDIMKTLIPVLIFSILFEKYCGAETRQYASAFTGLCCMLGHAYPVWYRFKGGKTFLTWATTVWFVDWKVGLVFLAVFLLMLFTIKFMSLASMTAAGVCPFALMFFGYDAPAVLVLVFMAAALLIWRHKGNIKRLVKGDESKFSLFGKSKAA